ncbi:NAD-dependent protein deacetylase of SIR2 family [Mariniradius saccharolyticus AK6]|uniref:NAD-dependent protein deacylase n=1 Tax=Mariniradius saccharolyticus AK6 TaxID=1239962 RepID=M7XTZ8_9BACT|nr:NAD-dependent deacylase [Mariniradius saccharolyticus]EMS31957.1 NAD-dependent protein deacetylase of SIR2 family [Mariniradius saccharolyticus AK6]
MKKLVVLTGAGISAESGISTFRDSGGLWEGHDVMEVASPEGWRKNRELVLDFYNQRRKQALSCEPNAAHLELARLEEHFEVTIVTQNVDNLHEKAGSSKVIHLHGELFKVRSTLDPNLIYDLDGWELKLGDKCEKGSQLRPHIVWFGEMVPMMESAIEHALSADIFAVIGTSLLVYPAAGLIEYTQKDIPKYIIDKQIPAVNPDPMLQKIRQPATIGTVIMAKEIIRKYA